LLFLARGYKLQTLSASNTHTLSSSSDLFRGSMDTRDKPEYDNRKKLPEYDRKEKRARV